MRRTEPEEAAREAAEHIRHARDAYSVRHTKIVATCARGFAINGKR